MATASVFDALKPLAGRAIESALNRLLALDPETRDAVSALEGRCIQLTLEAPSLSLEVRVRGGRLVVGPADTPETPAESHGPSRVASSNQRPSNEPDLAVRGTLGGLLSQLPFLRPAAGAGIGKVKIAGDADLARQLQQIAERFDPDWNLPFTDLFGEVAGVQIASALRAAFRSGREGSNRFARDAAQYLTEESRDVIGRAELDAHLDDIDALRDRVERLHARMQQMHRRLGGDAQVAAGPKA